jgi:aspartate aminotransferase-like enzyme
MTPGPTRVPTRVLAAGARPMLHHRSPEFAAELGTLLALLAPVFGTRTPVLPLHSTGRGAMEAAIANFFSPDDEIAACCNGKFGALWATLADSYGLVVHRVATEWDADIEIGALEATLDRFPGICAVTLPYCDTSSGVINDIAAIARIAGRHGALVLVDGVSAIGGMPFEFDAWQIDVAVTASQKCLMSSPGLAFAAVSDRAWRRGAAARLPRQYWDLEAVRQAVTRPKPETPGTPPVHVVFQVVEALRAMHEEGLERVYERHETMGRMTRDGAAALGLPPQCPAHRRPSPTMTAIGVPAALDATAIRGAVKARGILTAAGLGPYEGAAIRIGHMGDIRPADVERTLVALRDSLAALTLPA